MNRTTFARTKEWKRAWPARYRALNVPGSGINALISRRLTMVSWSRFLGASTEWPGVVPVDAEIGNLDLLAETIMPSPPICAPSPPQSTEMLGLRGVF